MFSADRHRVTVLTWDPVCRRSTSLAARLGRSLHTVHFLLYRRPWIAPVKYVAQAVRTWIVLWREKTRITMVSNPPVFSVLAVYLYAALTGTHFVMDSHTGAFFERKWRAFLWLHRFLARRALLSIVTNDHLRELVESWGAEAAVLEDPLPRMSAAGSRYRLDPKRFNVAVVFSFSADEPVEEVLGLKNLPADVSLYVTGNPAHIPAHLRDNVASNVVLTGFLSEADYAALLKQSDAVMVLCTVPHTMLCGAYEAAENAKPLITSDWPEMRAYFARGTRFVDNSTASIERAIAEVRRDAAALRAEMAGLRQELEDRWQRRFDALMNRIAEKARAPLPLRRIGEPSSSVGSGSVE